MPIDQTRVTLFAPEDPCQDALLSFVSGTTGHLRIADYSFNLDPLVQLLITLHRNGVDVALVLDKSQAAGSSEVPEVAKLRAAGVPFVTGTSLRHKIMHDKYIIRDHEWVLSGSYNFTHTASLENNVLAYEHNPALAAAFLMHWQTMWDWITANEPQAAAPLAVTL